METLLSHIKYSSPQKEAGQAPSPRYEGLSQSARVSLPDVIRKSTLPGHEGVPPNALIEVPTSTEPPVPLDTTPSSTASPIPGFLCHCGKRFTRKGGLNLHYRKKHNPSQCSFCDFKWGRAYEYREHIEGCHLDINPDTILRKPAGSRKRTTPIARHPQQQQALPLTVEHDESRYSEISPASPHPPVFPSPEHPIGTPPVMPVAHGPQLEDAGSLITTPEHASEDAHVPYTDAPSSFPSIEEWAQLLNNLDNITQGYQTRLARSLLYPTYAPTGTGSPGTLLPAPTPPFGSNSGLLDFMNEPSSSVRPDQFPQFPGFGPL